MNFFQNIFSRKSESVELKELKNWLILNNHVKKKLKPEIIDFYENIKSCMGELYNNLIVLDKLDINDVKAEIRLKQLVQGNKMMYTKNVDSFLKRIDIPKEHDYETALKFCNDLKKGLQELHGQTARNFYVVKNLVGKELEAVVENLRKMNSSISKMGGLLDKYAPDVSRYKFLESKIDKLINKVKKEKDRKFVLIKRNEDINLLKDEQKRVRSKIKRLKEGKDFLKLQEEKTKLEEINQELNRLASEIMISFVNLVKVFKKYDNERKSNVFEHYIVDQTSALSEDKDLKIVDNLAIIKKELENGHLDIRGDKAKKALEAIKRLDKKYLEELRTKFCQLKRDRIELKENIKNNKIEEEILEESKKLKGINDKLFELENYNPESLSFEDDLNEIRNEIRSLTKISVNIKYGSLD